MAGARSGRGLRTRAAQVGAESGAPPPHSAVLAGHRGVRLPRSSSAASARAGRTPPSVLPGPPTWSRRLASRILLDRARRARESAGHRSRASGPGSDPLRRGRWPCAAAPAASAARGWNWASSAACEATRRSTSRPLCVEAPRHRGDLVRAVIANPGRQRSLRAPASTPARRRSNRRVRWRTTG